jgi:hypothetical protein
MDPYSKVDYSRITPEAGMVMKKASADDSPLRQGVGKSFQYVSWKSVHPIPRIFHV